jgi:hypothetical protein
MKKMLVITDWLFIQSLGPCGFNFKLIELDSLGMVEPLF